MAAVATLLCVAMVTTAVAAATPADDEVLVRQYVQQFGNQTFREASGNMKYRYLVPGAALLPSKHYLGQQFRFALTRPREAGGYYQQLWDWDSMMTGAGLLAFGSAPYLAGSMMNFLDGVNLTTGMVKGCVPPPLPVPPLHGASLS